MFDNMDEARRTPRLQITKPFGSAWSMDDHDVRHAISRTDIHHRLPQRSRIIHLARFDIQQQIHAMHLLTCLHQISIMRKQ